MAVYTRVDEPVLRAFLAGYELGALVAYRGITEGVENSNWRLDTTTGRYILTVYEKRVDVADLPYFVGLMRHLAQRGVRCPLPIDDRGGEALGRLAGKPAAIFGFLDGDWPRTPDTAHCRAVGDALAGLHRAGLDFPQSRVNALSRVGWRPLVEACVPRADEVEPGVAALIEVELAQLERAWPERLPTGVIHADLFPDNVFFQGGRLSGVIDLYFACNDILAYDLAIAVNAWCFAGDGALDRTRTAAMVAGYEAARPLSDAEKAAFPILARGAAFRFLLTRLHDWLHRVDGALVEPKDPREYLAKLRFHRTAEGAATYGLG